MKNTDFKQRYNYKYLLRLLSCALSGATPEKPNENTDWASVFYLANRHSVAGMTCYAVDRLPKEHKPQQDIMDKFTEAKRCELILESNIEFETSNLLSRLSESKLQIVLLKGMVLKHYYPVSSMRTMSDVDILYREQDKKVITEIMKSLGYKLTLDFDGELNFTKPPFYHYEFHPYRVSGGLNSHRYYDGIWDKASFKVDDAVGKLMPEAVYIYMLRHLAKHIENAGAGLRMVMDVFVFLNKEKKKLDCRVVNAVLEKLGLLEFSLRITKLAYNWFDGKEPDTESIGARFVLDSETFGTSRTAILQTNIRNENKTGKKHSGFKRIIRKIFPAYRHICARFPSAKKLAVLYPFYIPLYWCLRIFKDKNINTSNIGNYFAKTDSADARNILLAIDELGLSNRLE